jgi:hypothetical protein
MSDLALGDESVATRFTSVKGLIFMAFQKVEVLHRLGTSILSSTGQCQIQGLGLARFWRTKPSSAVQPELDEEKRL